MTCRSTPYATPCAQCSTMRATGVLPNTSRRRSTTCPTHATRSHGSRRSQRLDWLDDPPARSLRAPSTRHRMMRRAPNSTTERPLPGSHGAHRSACSSLRCRWDGADYGGLAAGDGWVVVLGESFVSLSECVAGSSVSSTTMLANGSLSSIAFTVSTFGIVHRCGWRRGSRSTVSARGVSARRWSAHCVTAANSPTASPCCERRRRGMSTRCPMRSVVPIESRPAPGGGYELRRDRWASLLRLLRSRTSSCVPERRKPSRRT